MQRILSVYDWQRLPSEEQIVINSDVPGQRLVRLRVNAPAPVALYVQLPDIVDPVFLAQVNGLDMIEFNVEGSYKLFAFGGELWFDTLDGTRADVEAVDPTSYTSIVERKARNPELEIMERKMAENLDRRMSILIGQVSAQLEEKELQLVAARTAAEEAMRTARKQDAGQVPPNPPAESADGGDAGGGVDAGDK